MVFPKNEPFRHFKYPMLYVKFYGDVGVASRPDTEHLAALESDELDPEPSVEDEENREDR